MIMLGNILFDQVEERIGYRLTDDDKELWNKFHCNNADLSDKDAGFHIFDIPACIYYKGTDAFEAIIKMFSPEKLINPVGTFEVYEKERKGL